MPARIQSDQAEATLRSAGDQLAFSTLGNRGRSRPNLSGRVAHLRESPFAQVRRGEAPI